MIRCRVIIKEFTLERFNELKNIKRKSIEVNGKLLFGDTFELVGDTFEYEKELAYYLSGKNDKGIIAVKVIEVIPEPEKDEQTIEK